MTIHLSLENQPLFQQAMALQQSGRLPEAAGCLRELLHALPGNSQLLAMLGLILLKTGQFADSAQYLQQSVAIEPLQPQTYLYLGIALMRLQQFEAALASYEQAIALKADYADAFCNKGNALVELKRFADALSSFNAAIAIKPDFVLAYFNRGNLLQEMKQFNQAIDSYQRTIALKPDFAEAFCNISNALRKLQRLDEALHYCDQAIALRGNDANHWFSRGNVLQDLQRFEEALSSYRQATQLKADLAEAWLKCGDVLKHLKRFAEALPSYDQAIAIQPGLAEAFANKGITLIELRRFPEALDCFAQAIAINPSDADAFCNRGLALHGLNRFTEALDSYQQALSIKSDYVEVYNNRGNTLKALNRPDEALLSFDRAIAIKADFSEAFCNRGVMLGEQLKRFEEGIASCDRAIAINPNFAEAYNNKAVILENAKLYREAGQSYEQALAINPDLDFVPGQSFFCKLMSGDWRSFNQDLSNVVKKIPLGIKVVNPFTLLSITDDPALQRQAADIWTTAKFPAFPAAFLLKYPRHDRIRIAYFSGDFCNHPVALLSARLYEMHDRQEFEIFGFSYCIEKDEMTTRLEAGFDHFIDIRRISDFEAVELARSLEIDIAVDLGGHTTSRNGIFAMRAAPLQVNFLGYAGTLAAEYIDYQIADRKVIPENSRRHYSEKIAYLPDSFLVNDTGRPISGKVFSRKEFDLPDDGFVFCCFNNTYKFNPPMFDAWMRILHGVPDSVLWLSVDNAATAGNLQQEAVQRGISADRLIFAKRLPVMEEHLARLRIGGLFLDTLPYNAHTTACDALWAGLPVLTCMGESFAGRVAASLLSAIELPELITVSLAEYEALAIELASHPEKIAAIKTKLAENRLTTALFDTGRFTKNIETAYRQMYQNHRAGLAPEHIFI
jgi:predicted O-linked N-acetylglucosamine transferase (SPINDLY family)